MRDHPERSATYRATTYQHNRAIVLARDPWCRLRLPGCTGKSTTVDHVLSVAKGGRNDIGNLRGACGNCNRRRGAAEGRAAQKRRAALRKEEQR
jgi:5-methylcytosine-specific restriction endonuclease McrA